MEPQHDTEPQREDRDDGTGDGPRFPEAVGDILRANVTGELPGTPSRCTEIWVGEETLKQVTAQQSKKLAAKK